MEVRVVYNLPRVLCVREPGAMARNLVRAVTLRVRSSAIPTSSIGNVSLFT